MLPLLDTEGRTTATQVIGPRATALIAEACVRGGTGTVLLPALFCSGVAEALEAKGLRYRCYDMPRNLASVHSEIVRSLRPDVRSVVLFHPFGLTRPLAEPLAGEVNVVEDACHALRTAVLDDKIGASGQFTVFSMRKELNWRRGGLASGPGARLLRAKVRPAPLIEDRWLKLDLNSVVEAGRDATVLACSALGTRLPDILSTEILSVLPLKSATRDQTINRLRSRGVPAWRWRTTLKGVSGRVTPNACVLSEQLILVTYTQGEKAERILSILSEEQLLPWHA